MANAGVILHSSNGSIWTEMENPGYYLYNDVWGNGNNVYAVGESGGVGGIQFYNGIEWAEVDISTENSLNGVWVCSRGVAFVVGDNGTVLQSGENGTEPCEAATFSNGVLSIPVVDAGALGTFS